MRKPQLAFLVSILALFLTTNAQGALKLKKVILYPSSATLVWEGIAAPRPEGFLILGYLPSSAVKDSVKVQLGKPLELLELRIQEVKEDPQLERMEKEIRNLRVQLEILETQKRFIQGVLSTQKESKGQGWWERIPLKETLARLQTLSNKMRALISRIEELQKTIEEREEALAKWKRAHSWKIEARTRGKGQATVQLTYRVNQAGWRPLYAARLVNDKVSLKFMARVHQDTEINWQGVKVVLSTARPRGRIEPPQPKPLYLRPVEPLKTRFKLMPLAGKAPPKDERAALEEKTTYSLMEGIALYEPPGPFYLDSGKEGVLSIEGWTLLPKIKRFCYAAADPAVYIVANIKSFPRILPPGKMQLYQGSSLVGETYLTFRAPLKLSFGRDQTLKVKREQTKRFLDKKFGGKVEITVAYQTTITNVAPRTREIEVVERIPVSQDERIEVKFKGAEPPAEPNKKKGFLKWTVTVLPHGKSKLSYTFTVKYPEKLHLNYPF